MTEEKPNPAKRKYRNYSIAERLYFVEKFERAQCKIASRFAEVEGINVRVFQVHLRREIYLRCILVNLRYFCYSVGLSLQEMVN